MNEIDVIESVIGPSLVVKGEIHSSGTLRIDGVVEGSITSKGAVVVANEGIVEADIKADHIVVGGTVNGDVVGREKVEVLTTGRLHGDISTKLYGLVISEGAIFEGACRMKGPEGTETAVPNKPKPPETKTG